jgi:hypothetical protein
MKYAFDRPYSDPDAAARKLVEIANSVEAIQDGRIFIELINGSLLFEHRASPAEYKAGLRTELETLSMICSRASTKARSACSASTRLKAGRATYLRP